MHKIGNPLLYYAAAATTAIVGILHLILVPPPYNPYVLEITYSVKHSSLLQE
jgi:hypothetical protein